MKSRNVPSEPFGLEAWLEKSRVVLPLRGLSFRADITAGFADVAVDQLFEQTNEQALDCRFLFPLPADAAAYRCEMHVNGRVILAKIEERAAARKHFKKLKASGRRAALAESERDNLFTLQLGNLQPGDLILMRFAYLQPVHRLREQRTLRVPVNPGVRYIPGEPLLRENSGPGSVDDTDLVPDASRITPPRIDADHPDAAALHVSVRLNGAGDLADSASSPSHPVVMKRDGEDLVAAIAPGGHLPDRDFVFTWNEKPPAKPVIRAWLDENRRGVLEIRLPVGAAPVANPADLPDVYFLLDRSGSMQGANWTGACKALAAFAPRLHPDTRVWLTLFESETRDYDAVPVRAGDIDFGPDGKRIHHHGTTGGTELVPALRHLAVKMREHSSGRPTTVLLITDGEIGNEHGAVSAAKELGCPVHLLGLAMTVNDGLDAIARETGGRSVFLAPGEDIPAAVERFAPILRAPVVTGLSLTPGWQIANESALRNLCDGDDIVTPISAAKDAIDLDVGGHAADGSLWSVVPERQTLPSAGLVWARARIRHLDASKRNDEALELAKQFNLLSRGAAFIAWDDAEKVPVAQTEIVQPAMEVAEGMVMHMAVCADSAPPKMRSCSPRFSRPRVAEGDDEPDNAPRRAPRKSAGKKARSENPEIGAVCKQVAALSELLLEEVSRFFNPRPVPERLIDAVRQLRDFAQAAEHDPDAALTALLLIEQFREEFDKALAEHHHRLREEIARLDALREKSRELKELQNQFRLLEV